MGKPSRSPAFEAPRATGTDEPSPIKRFRGDRRAVTAVEFAFVAPIVLWVIFQICQIGLYFFFSATLFRVTETATRQILLGSVANSSLSATQYRNNVLCPLLPREMTCDNIITNIQVAPSQASGGFYGMTDYATSQSNPLGYTMTGLKTPPLDNSKTSFCIGGSGSVVAVQVYYAMPILGLPWMLPGSTMWNGQPSVFISATSVFKNEPFTTTYQGC